MEGINAILVFFGIPTAITGLAVWFLQRRITRNEKELREKEANQEKLILMMIQCIKLNSAAIESTADALQRVPGVEENENIERDIKQMEDALEKMITVQKQEHQFLLEQGVKHIFD